MTEYNSAGTLLKRYIHGPGADEPVAIYDGPALGLANRRYMLPDHQGSIAALINADGTPSVINSYNEYGVPGAGNAGRFQYTGQAWIPELGLYHYKARLYSPALGRFLQVDPIGYEDQINLYAYVRNDPINLEDMTGTECSSLECWADTDKPAKVHIVAVPSNNSVALANMHNFTKPASENPFTGARTEPTGAAVAESDGTVTVKMLKPSGILSNNADKQRVTVPADALFLQHGHLEQDGGGYTVVDKPEESGGWGDTNALTRGIPNYTVAGDRLGVRDAPGGILHFEMLVGKMSRGEAAQMTRNINTEQRVLERYWRKK